MRASTPLVVIWAISLLLAMGSWGSRSPAMPIVRTELTPADVEAALPGEIDGEPIHVITATPFVVRTRRALLTPAMEAALAAYGSRPDAARAVFGSNLDIDRLLAGGVEALSASDLRAMERWSRSPLLIGAIAFDGISAAAILDRMFRLRARSSDDSDAAVALGHGAILFEAADGSDSHVGWTLHYACGQVLFIAVGGGGHEWPDTLSALRCR